MEKLSISPKFVIILLSMLLIAGAVAAFSIDGGKWLTSNALFSQSPQEPVQQNVVVPVTGPGLDVQTVDEQSPPSEYGCHHDSAMNPADW